MHGIILEMMQNTKQQHNIVLKFSPQGKENTHKERYHMNCIILKALKCMKQNNKKMYVRNIKIYNKKKYMKTQLKKKVLKKNA